MAITYTRGQIRIRVLEKLRDSSAVGVTTAVVHRRIDEIVRKFVEFSECNREEVIVTISDPATLPAPTAPVVKAALNGTVSADITMTSAASYEYYTIGTCQRLDKIHRWVPAGDGRWLEVERADDHMCDVRGLYDTTSDYPDYYQPISENVIRFLPVLNTAAYPFDLKLNFRKKVVDMIQNDSDPANTTATGVVIFSGAGLNDVTRTGTYTGSVGAIYTITISTTIDGPPDWFTWNLNGGAESAEIAITGTAQTLSNGVSVTFGAVTGHTVTDKWYIYCDDPRTPSVPLEYRHALVDGVVGSLLDDRGDASAQGYWAQFWQVVADAKKKYGRLSNDKRPPFRANYRGAGG